MELGCLDEDVVLGFVEGLLEQEAIARADAHLAGCASCREVVAAIARSSTADRAEARAQRERVGRYVLLDTIGSGSMGVVYAAWDPDLDRRIAIKLLRDARGAVEPHVRELLLREGRAIAKLNHPNVVAVHDVGSYEHGVFFAMEYVEGGTLATWASASDRVPADRVISAYAQAARGLAAAHAAGLVHRDVKPSNLLVGADQRVRVADFGLALAETGDAALPHARGSTSGRMVGTPLYMAPEVMNGAAADARADQYALAASLYETLGGSAPFAGRTLDELRAAKKSSMLAPPERAIPASILAVIRRAMQPDPDARWPSINHIAERLTHHLHRQRRRWLTAGATLAAGTIGALIVMNVSGRTAPIDRCEAGPARFAEVWAPARASAVRAGTSARVSDTLDRYASSWTSGFQRVCSATTRGEQSEALLDVRMRCLDERRHAFGALAELLATRRDDTTRTNAVSAALHLAPVTECDRVDALVAIPPPPLHLAGQVDTAAQIVDRAEALLRTGQFADGLAAIKTVPSLPYPALVARAAFVRGQLEQELGDPTAAEATLYAAGYAAAEARDDLLAARSWTLLVGVVGYLANRSAEGLALARIANALVARAGASESVGAELASMRGLVFDTLGKFDEARAEHERALAIRERTQPDSLELAQVLDNLGAIPLQQQRYEEADRHYRRALAIRRRVLGDDHPDVAASWNSLGAAQRGLEHLADARASYDAALAIWKRTLGEAHPNVASVLVNLGHLAREMKLPAESERYLTAAVAAWRARGDAHAADLGSSLGGLANLAFDRGDLATAESYAREGLERMEHALGATHPRLVSLLDSLARIRRARGDTTEANALTARADALRPRTSPP